MEADGFRHIAEYRWHALCDTFLLTESSSGLRADSPARRRRSADCTRLLGTLFTRASVVKRLILYVFVVVVATIALLASDAPAARKAPELAFNIPSEGQRLLS